MLTREAYEMTIELCSSNKRNIISSFYDENNFGNFVVTYEQNSRINSLINDRGSIMICKGDPNDTSNCEVLIESLFLINEANFKSILEPHLQ